MDLQTLRSSLEAESYIFDEDFLLTLYIAIKLNKPLLIEGAAGVGKTEVAKTLATLYGVDLIRLQCYEGLDESKSLYEWNYQKQLLSMQLSSTIKINQHLFDPLKISSLYTEEFLLERPLLKAISSTQKSVLLIDEIDKTDEEFEAFLLELLSDFQVSIPELGTIKAKNRPIIILTSNSTRQLSDALKRRCIFYYIDYPSLEKEMKIIISKFPKADDRLVKDVAEAVAFLRQQSGIFKKPSIAETLDWIAALMALDKKKLDEEYANKTLGLVLKNNEDITEFQKGGGFYDFFSKKHN